MVVGQVKVGTQIAEHLKNECEANKVGMKARHTRHSSSFPFKAATCSAVFPDESDQSRING